VSSNLAQLNNGGSGGGVEGGILNDCILTGNQAEFGGGADGGYLNLNWGVLNNCSLFGNITSGSAGGAAYVTLNNCMLAGNIASNGNAGGAYSCALNNCTLLANVCYASYYESGGGGASGSTLIGCVVISNVMTKIVQNPSVPVQGGGTLNCSLIDCLLAYNTATNGGGDSGSTLINCTVVSNSASAWGGVYNSILKNSIVYDNLNGDCFSSASRYSLNYCCTTQPTNGVGNITNDPAFVNLAGGDFHLQGNSPCINSGDNAFVTVTSDLDGNPRVVGGTVDMGAYEYQSPGSVLSYAWAQQYGLPTDGSVDYLDLDGTAMPNWQKSIAGLNPTNSASVLAMLPLAATNLTNGVTVSWDSVNTRMYYLLRSTNLAVQPAFSAIQSNLVGQAGFTSFKDTGATNGGPYFYRVGVQ
jgi:hypothetical protein